MCALENTTSEAKLMALEERTMVAISTRQNTTNFVPFLQFDFDTMLLLETVHARREKWSEGLKKALKERGKAICLFEFGDGTDLGEMLKIVRTISQEYNQLCWNIGGGQKMQQMALLRVFQQRLDIHAHDWACYADPGSRSVYTIRLEKGDLQSTKETIGAGVSLDDILSIFGLKKRHSNKPLLLWSSSHPHQLPGNENFCDLTVFWDREKRHQLMYYVLTGKGEAPGVLRGLKHGYPDYFEQVAQYEVARVLKDNAPHHHVLEAWANVRVKDSKDDEIAEWDIVLVTDFGTLVILDAKTGNFGSKDSFRSKDAHARLFNLDRATGAYGEFWLIIPYLFEDMQNGGFYVQHSQEGKPYRKMPFELAQITRRFIAVMGRKEPIYLKKLRKDKVAIREHCETDTEKSDILKLNDISTILNELRLLKTSD
jgi:hypothetical protein